MLKKSLMLLMAALCVITAGCGRNSDSKSANNSSVNNSSVNNSKQDAVLAAVIEAGLKNDAEALWSLTHAEERSGSDVSKEELLKLCNGIFSLMGDDMVKVMLAVLKSNDGNEFWDNLPEDMKKQGKKSYDRLINNFSRSKEELIKMFSSLLISKDDKYYVSVHGAVLMKPQLEKARLRAQMANSVVNLKQIGLAIIMYGGDHKDYFPGNFAELTVNEYIYGTRVFVAPYDKKSTVAADGKILPQNTSYAYVMDKSIKMYDLKNPSSTPVAFEKPWVMPDAANGINVLFADGHVEFVAMDNIRNMSCRDVTSRLLQLNGRPADPADKKLLQNAGAIDKLR